MGRLYCLNWAAAHPDKTLAVYLDNAVCDFKSWPGGACRKLGASTAGSDAEWKKMLAAHDFKTDEEAVAYKLNPADNLAPLAKAEIPLLLVYGDADRAAPHAENSGLVYDRYKALGGPVQRVVKPGQDHYPHGPRTSPPSSRSSPTPSRRRGEIRRAVTRRPGRASGRRSPAAGGRAPP